MEKTKNLIKVNLPGGIVYPGDLLEVLAIAKASGVKSIRFGNRQQLIFWVASAQLEDLEHSFFSAGVLYEVDADDYPNIMSSYVTEEILNPTNWLREGVYKDILNSFNHRPKLKINIVDHDQNLIPFFTGHLNFVSSEVSNYWFLSIRYPQTNQMYSWPTLVYSEDIPLISKLLEEKLLNNTERGDLKLDCFALYQKIAQENGLVGLAISKKLQHSKFQLPYYEGFNRYGQNKLWLGIYRRNEEFAVELLEDIAEICIKTRIGQLYTTPWKSIIIKSIQPNDRKFWSHLLDKHRLNVRHAANELNWQLEDVCEEALALKLYLAKYFEEADLRTFGLCFAIKTKPRTGLFGSVIIRKKSEKTAGGAFLYEVLHTKNFNPNNKEFVVFAAVNRKEDLAASLSRLCEYYYSLELNFALPEFNEKTKESRLVDRQKVHQCKHCKTIFDDRYGDEFNNVKPGLKFEEIMEYRCPLCEAPKEDFVAVEI
ncbi:MAG TPA: rubredoxin domain-containing protein [Pelobium sp.]